LPIIILSAKASVDDKLKGIGLGIDDYMVKPFDPRELEARIKMRLKHIADMD
jgi:DNA-binding response OmpR family regulator